MMDYQARLNMVQAAIEAVLTGGHVKYEIDGQSVEKLDLATLQAMESKLIAQVNRTARRGGAFRTAHPL